MLFYLYLYNTWSNKKSFLIPYNIIVTYALDNGTLAIESGH